MCNIGFVFVDLVVRITMVQTDQKWDAQSKSYVILNRENNFWEVISLARLFLVGGRGGVVFC